MAPVSRFLTSLYTAFGGLVIVVRTERNARIHLGLAVLALVLSAALGVSNAQLAAIFFAIILVFLAEIMNTALEKTLDLIDLHDNDQVRLIKDIAAGAVLVTAIGALAIGAAIFVPYLTELRWHT
jgi:diacylglycerol kinase